MRKLFYTVIIFFIVDTLFALQQEKSIFDLTSIDTGLPDTAELLKSGAQLGKLQCFAWCQRYNCQILKYEESRCSLYKISEEMYTLPKSTAQLNQTHFRAWFKPACYNADGWISFRNWKIQPGTASDAASTVNVTLNSDIDCMKECEARNCISYSYSLVTDICSLMSAAFSDWSLHLPEERVYSCMRKSAGTRMLVYKRPASTKIESFTDQVKAPWFDNDYYTNEIVLDKDLQTGNGSAVLKSVVTKIWEQLHIQRVRISIISNNNEEHYITFDATDSSYTDWFEESRITESSWDGIMTGLADVTWEVSTATRRGPYIVKSYAHCSGDLIYLMVHKFTTKGSPCDYDEWYTVAELPVISYAIGSDPTHPNAHGQADSMNFYIEF